LYHFILPSIWNPSLSHYLTTGCFEFSLPQTSPGSSKYIAYSTDYHQWTTLESWFTNLEQTPLNFPPNYLHLTNDSLRTSTRKTNNRQTEWFYQQYTAPTDIWITKDGLNSTNHILKSSQPITLRLSQQTSNNIVSLSSNQVNNQRLECHLLTIHSSLD